MYQDEDNTEYQDEDNSDRNLMICKGIFIAGATVVAIVAGSPLAPALMFIALAALVLFVTRF
jgi:hypothetical protein